MPRFRNALIIALALHGAFMLLRPRARAISKAADATSAQELEVDTTIEEPRVAAEAEPEAAEGVAVAAPAPASNAPHAPSTPAAAAALAPAGEGEPVAVAEGVGTAEPVAAAPARPIDLGLDGRMFLHLPSNAPVPGPASADTRPLGPRAPRSDVQRQLQASLAADDVKRGLARGNALLGSLDTAVRGAGPVRGEALVRVTVGADGSLLGVELAGGRAEEWAAAVRSFRELATRKRVRLPPGARGMRISFSVKAKVQRPSGKEVEASAVGVDEPSLKPNGLSLKGDFDLADLGGGAQRLVYARVVSEEVL